jgi:hypothetical protein
MAKRTTKWYRKNEAEVMHRLGFEPTRNSGATWIDKGDGQNEHCLCELKSTDHESFSIKQSVLHQLEAQAIEAHKLPVFAFQFINTDEVWVAIKESDIAAFKALMKGVLPNMPLSPLLEKGEENVDKIEAKVYNNTCKQGNTKENLKARMAYMKQKELERAEREQEFKKKNKERRKESRWREN